MTYDFVSWENLNQRQHDQYVDLIGRVAAMPVKDMNQSLPKSYICLVCGELSQEIVLLGDHAGLPFDVNELVAFSGVRMYDYKGARTLQTAYLTVIERNPTKRDNVPEIPVISPDEPRRKAIRMAPRNEIRVR